MINFVDMLSPSQAVLAEIRSKIERLAAQRDNANARIARLEQEISDLKADLNETRKELQRSRTDAEFLSLSHRLADTPEALVTSRRIIASLIRKVDAAINMLKNDPSQA